MIPILHTISFIRHTFIFFTRLELLVLLKKKKRFFITTRKVNAYRNSKKKSVPRQE